MKKTFLILLLVILTTIPMVISHEEGDDLTIQQHEEQEILYAKCGPLTGCDPSEIPGFTFELIGSQTLYVEENQEFEFKISTAEGAYTGQEIQAAIHEPGTEVGILYLATEEVIPGTYKFEWSPNFAGDYEIRYAFRNIEGTTVAPLYKLQVIDKRAVNATYGSLALAILIIGLSTALSFKKKGRKKKFVPKTLIVGIIIGLAVYGLGYSLSQFYSEGGEKGFIVCGDEGCDLAIHIHSQLHMSVCGEEYNLGLEKGDLGRTHTHKERDYLHFHALIKTDITGTKILEPEKIYLGELFDQLNIPFTKTCFADKCNGDLCPNGQPGTLKVIVNGIPNEDFDEYVWNDDDEIEIRFD